MKKRIFLQKQIVTIQNFILNPLFIIKTTYCIIFIALFFISCGEFEKESGSNTNDNSNALHKSDLSKRLPLEVNKGVKYEDSGDMRDTGDNSSGGGDERGPVGVLWDVPGGSSGGSDSSEAFNQAMKDFEQALQNISDFFNSDVFSTEGGFNESETEMLRDMGTSGQSSRDTSRMAPLDGDKGNELATGSYESTESTSPIDVTKMNVSSAYTTGKDCVSLDSCMKPILNYEKWKKMHQHLWDSFSEQSSLLEPYQNKLVAEAIAEMGYTSFTLDTINGTLKQRDTLNSVKRAYVEGLLSNKLFRNVLDNAEYNAIQFASSESYMQTLLATYMRKMVTTGSDGSLKPLGLTVDAEIKFYNAFKKMATDLAGKISYFGVLGENGEYWYGANNGLDDTTVGLLLHLNDIIRADEYLWEESGGQLGFKDFSEKQVGDYLASYIGATLVHEFTHNTETILESIGLKNLSENMPCSDEAGSFDHMIMASIFEATGLPIQTGSQYHFPARSINLLDMEGIYIIESVILGF